MKAIDLDFETGVFINRVFGRFEGMAQIDWKTASGGRKIAVVRDQAWELLPNPQGGPGWIFRVVLQGGSQPFELDEVFDNEEQARRAAEFSLMLLQEAEKLPGGPSQDGDHY